MQKNLFNKIRTKSLDLVNSGYVYHVRYLLLKEDEVKISSFIGLCISKKKKSNSVTLQNVVKKEKLKLTVFLNSPLIINLIALKRYKRKYRLNKLYYK